MSRKILIVDDEDIIRDGIVKLINWKECGYDSPDTAPDVPGAIEKLEREPYFAVLTDIRMQGLSGLDLCAEVHKRWPDCKLLIMSGYDEFEYARSAIRHGVLTYILKPVSKKELCEILDRLAAEDDVKGKKTQREEEDRFYAECPAAEENGTVMKTPEFSTLVAAIGQCHREDALRRVNAFVDALCLHRVPRDQRNHFCYILLYHLMQLIETIGSDEKEVFGENFSTDSYYTARDAETLRKHLERVCGQLLDYVESRASRISDRVIVDAASYIEKHCTEKITARTLGEAYYMNPAYLGRKFRMQHGISIQHYLNNCRIVLAKKLLVSTDAPTVSISCSVGYHNYDLFCLHFKHRVGMTPAQYRNLHVEEARKTP